MPVLFGHGIVGRADLPIPGALFAVAAALVLVVSFVSLAAGWTQPRLETPRERLSLMLPRAVDVVLGALGLAVFAIGVYAGLAGTDFENENLQPMLVYVAFWVGVPVLSLFLGDVFRLLSPWRAVGRLVGAIVPGADEPLEYRLGRWPAVAGIVAFAVVELCWGQGRDPQVLAVLALLYFVVQLAGMRLYGVETWTRNGDAFGVYFSFFASLSPLRRREDGRLLLRIPVTGAVALERPPGTVALLCVAIATTTFDGAKEGPLFTSLLGELQTFFTSLGLSPGAGLEAGLVVGLALTIGFISLLYWLGAPRGRTREFAHSLVPILAAYVVAHYFSLLAYNGQDLIRLASNPLGEGGDLFGTAANTIDYGVVTATGIWYVQVAALIIGHVAALVLAHDRALVIYGSAKLAYRSQLSMLTVMVAFTCLGLWLLSVANS